jgi:hypothetical protein
VQPRSRSLRARSLLRRHAVDALIAALAALAVAEPGSAPLKRPRAVTVPFALLWTLPLRFRRQFVRRPPPGAAKPAEPAQLIERELDVLVLVARGLSKRDRVRPSSRPRQTVNPAK